MPRDRTGGRAAEGTGLLNRRRAISSTVGSNPTLSAFRFADGAIDIALTIRPPSFDIPERKEIEKLISDFEAAGRRVESCDRQFFDELQSILTDEQQIKLEGERMSRKFDSWHVLTLNIPREMNDGAKVNLMLMVAGIEMSDEDRAQAEAMMAGYPQALNARMRNIWSVGMTAVVKGLDLLDEIGLRDMPMQELMEWGGDENNQQMLMESFDRISKPVQNAMHDLSSYNLATYNRIRDVISEDAAFELRQEFYEEAYPRLYWRPMRWRNVYERTLELESLDADVRQRINVLLDQHTQHERKLEDDMVGLIEKSREFMSFARLSRMEEDPTSRRIDELQEELRGVSGKAMSDLESLLTPEQIAERDHEAHAHEEDGAVSPTAESTPGAGESAAVDMQQREQEVSWRAQRRNLPSPMLYARVKEVADLLDLDPDERELFFTLYDDYRADYESHLNVPSDEELDAGREAAEWTQEMRDQHTSTLFSIDDRFFEDLSLALAADRVREYAPRFKAIRRRSAIRKMANERYWMGRRSQESQVDLEWVVIQQQLPADLMEKVIPVLDAYSQEAVKASQDLYEQAVEFGRLMDMWSKLNNRDAPPAVVEASQKRWENANRNANQALQGLLEVNKRHVELVLEKLPDDVAWRMRYAYLGEAFPDIYDESKVVTTVETAIRDLPDLTDDQRGRLDETISDFRARHFAICERMVSVRRDEESRGGFFEMPDRSRIQGFIDAERLEFDRNELEARAMLQMKLLLTEAQVAALGPDVWR
jgi:hypothetical protein